MNFLEDSLRSEDSDRGDLSVRVKGARRPLTTFKGLLLDVRYVKLLKPPRLFNFPGKLSAPPTQGLDLFFQTAGSSAEVRAVAGQLEGCTICLWPGARVEFV